MPYTIKLPPTGRNPADGAAPAAFAGSLIPEKPVIPVMEVTAPAIPQELAEDEPRHHKAAEPNTSSWQEIPESQCNEILWDLEAFQQGRCIVTAEAEPPDFPIVLCSNEITVEKAKQAGLIPSDAAVFTGAEYAMLFSIADRLSLEDVRELCEFKRILNAKLTRLEATKRACTEPSKSSPSGRN